MIYSSLQKNLLTKTLAIVGSASITVNQSDQIDGCDLVLRFNECKNRNDNCGRRGDILCITNTGAPADRIISSKSLTKLPFYRSVSEIWFPRNSRVHYNHFHADYSDKCKSILKSNGLDGRKIVRFNEVFNQFVFDLLKSNSESDFKCPSTGFFGIAYSLYDQRFVNYNKLIFGFSFSGTDWHPWETEKKIVEEVFATRPDVSFIKM